MIWNIEYTDEFGLWWGSLSEDEQISIAVSVQLLEERGPNLGFPHSSGINGSKHGHIVNYERNTMAGHSVRCMHLIHGGMGFCS